MEQLERRKNLWNELRVSGDMKKANLNSRNGKLSLSEKSTPDKVQRCFAPQDAKFNRLLEEDRELPSSSTSDVNKNTPMLLPKGVKEEEDSYNFYQATDGQHFILHSLNMKCLLHHYGSYERLPNRITGKILQLETLTQSEAMRR